MVEMVAVGEVAAVVIGGVEMVTGIICWCWCWCCCWIPCSDPPDELVDESTLLLRESCSALYDGVSPLPDESPLMLWRYSRSAGVNSMPWEWNDW